MQNTTSTNASGKSSNNEVSGFRFDEFTIDTANRALWRNNEQLSLSPRYFHVLELLVMRHGRLITRQELFETAWKDVYVGDSALTQCVKDIRKLLGDTAGNPRFIKTIPKQGYTFIGKVTEIKETAPAPTTETPARPYKFLSGFTRSDQNRFFGREGETRSILSQIEAHQTFLLYGRSGAGKSSLLAAGLTPALEERGFTTCFVNLSEDPMEELSKAIKRDLGMEHPPESGWPDHIRPVFCFDRSENLFRLAPQEALASFLCRLDSWLIQPGGNRLRFVFVVREDYLASISALKSVFPNIFHSEARLGLLSRENATLAMTQPARLCSCHFQPELLERILKDLSDTDGVDPPFLQIVCDRLFDARSSNGEFSLEAYEQMGAAAGILEHYLDRVLLRLQPHEVEVAKRLLPSLVSPEGARLTRPVGLICNQIARDCHTHGQAVRLVLEELAEARILLVRSEPGEVWVELIHDYLVTPVSHWMTDDFLSLARLRGVLERALRNYKEQQLLPGREELELLLAVGSALAPGPEAADMLLRACFMRAVPVPDWLAQTGQNFHTHIAVAFEAPYEEVRLTAVDASKLLTQDKANEANSGKALFDPSFAVRKASSVALAYRNGNDSVDLLKKQKPSGISGYLRFLTCLAMIRDENRKHFRLFGHGLFTGLAVTAGLALVRLRRGRAYGFQQLSSGAAGAMLGACLYTLLLAIVSGNHQAALALATVGSVAGLALGAGITLAMTSVELVGYRHETWWRIPAGIFAGAITAQFLHLIGDAIGMAFLGLNFPTVGGWMEGLLLAAGACIGGSLPKIRDHRMLRVLGAAAFTGLGAVAAAWAGGNLMAESLHEIGQILQNQWQLAPLWPQTWFKGALVSFAEGALFGGGLFAGLTFGPWRSESLFPIRPKAD